MPVLSVGADLMAEEVAPGVTGSCLTIAAVVMTGAIDQGAE